MKTIEKPQAIIYTTLFVLLAMIVLVLTLSGCISERIEGNRDLQTVERNSQPFSEVYSSGSFQVVIIPDTKTYVVVKAESNILPYINTIAKGDIISLSIDNNILIREHYPMEIFLHTPNFKKARLAGSGKVEFSGFETSAMEFNISGSGSVKGDLKTDKLTASISGSGTMKLSGLATSSSLFISGSGNMDNQKLSQADCKATITGSGTIITVVSKTLEARITGSGSIYYLGNPSISEHITGSGRVLKY